MVDNDYLGRGLYEPQGHRWQELRGTIHCSTQNMKALGHVVSEKFFFCISNRKSMGVIDPWA